MASPNVPWVPIFRHYTSAYSTIPQPDVEQALKGAIHNVELARIDLFLLKQRFQQSQESFIERLRDIEAMITTGHLPVNPLLATKRSIELSIEANQHLWKSRIATGESLMNMHIHDVDLLRWLKETQELRMARM